ncbi:carboxypeptidase-like regulatory domain-containing protein [Robertkochia solimangrovi]|uniref:carboxypeptidase-like regulatory domain-containing protein n=1 Tax=Robertkochia solimangrovi TaxID=2213046 RepID=UPI00117DA132|nr:carboxypeptidase-like regulatory domain-containing protein [Robertkochia solimangrovi]TRZ45289.1 carboxypeptidase-like regulatory domain-containing protein [Robertkochia solimangrovi]
MNSLASLTKQTMISCLLCFTMLFPMFVFPQDTDVDTLKFKEFKGKIVDSATGTELVFATLTVMNTNISTITNTEGEFSLKVPVDMSEGNVLINFLGYQSKTLSLNKFQRNGNLIELEPSTIELEEVSLSTPKDAIGLVRKMLKNKGSNYLDVPVKMTAFYRETIKKRRRDASLSEAVAYIYKQPYTSARRDIIQLFKSRKSTNYSRLDTVALKLQGGPFTPLYIDVMKYTDYIFTDELIDNYTFSFDQSTLINDKPVYVVNFRQRENIIDPLFYGKLYIDAESTALTSAVFNLNLENRQLASELLVARKPPRTDVYPTEAAYRVDYRIKDGKWYFGYANVQLAFVVDKKGKLFNSKYYVSSEMAVTDWEVDGTGREVKPRDRLSPTVIISDEAAGFSDPEFWGAYNVIEPEKSIESAINKIQRQLKREEG